MRALGASLTAFSCITPECNQCMCNLVVSFTTGGGVVVLSVEYRTREFESRPGTQRKNSHTYVPLFTKQYKLVPAKGR